ncbi:MAG: DUF2269 family protein [Thermoleophilaceae bacterium]|nr:DUF2269 family protein [Thermoleophilaceae bacterium]
MITALTMYTLATAIHVIFVVSFLAPAGAFSVIGPMARDNPPHAIFALKVNKKIYETLILPGVLVIWLTGIYQSADGGFAGDDLWLWISVGLFALSSIAAVFVLYPAVKFVLAELEARTEPGPPSEASQSKLKMMGKIGPLMGINMIVITFLMVAQPF